MFIFFARARTFKALEVNFLAHICFKSVGINVQIDLRQKRRIFSQKAHALICSDSFKTTKSMQYS